MGEIADWMLEGGLCEGCGEYLGEGDGYPRRCSACSRDDREAPTVVHAKVKCPTCGKRVKELGLSQHQRDAHKSAGGI